MRLSKNAKILRNFIYSLYSYINFYILKKKDNEYQKKIIFLHFLKSQEIIIVYFFIISIFTNIFTIIVYRKKLVNLSNEKKKITFNFLKKFSLIKFNKTIELVHAIIILSDNYNEKVVKSKISNYIPEDNNFYCENIVIGSGPSGSVTALSLKEKKQETLILEAGELFSIPAQKHSGFEFINKWLFGGLSGAVGNIDIQYASAKCVGGGSEINSGLFHEIDKDFVTKTYNDENMYENIKKFEPKNIVESQNDHSSELRNLRDIYRKGSYQLSWKIEDLKRFKKNNVNIKNSMTNTYLKKYKEIGGKILTNSKVNKFEEKNGQFYLDIKNKKKNITLKCKNLFICCGAPYSLNLLKKSKIVSNNLNSDFHFHPMFKIIAKYNSKVNSDKSIDVIETQVTEFFPNYIFGNAASGKQFLKISTFNNYDAYADVEKNFENMTIYHATFSAGKSKFLNIPFFKEPIISYKFSKQELSLIKKGIKNLIEFIFQSGAEYIYLNDNKITKINRSELSNVETILNKISLSLSAVHLLGGMNMLDKKNFDEKIFGKLKNSKLNIYVNDSTLLNQKLLKNPQGAVMVVSKNNIMNYLKKLNNE